MEVWLFEGERNESLGEVSSSAIQSKEGSIEWSESPWTNAAHQRSLTTCRNELHLCPHRAQLLAAMPQVKHVEMTWVSPQSLQAHCARLYPGHHFPPAPLGPHCNQGPWWCFWSLSSNVNQPLCLNSLKMSPFPVYSLLAVGEENTFHRKD